MHIRTFVAVLLDVVTRASSSVLPLTTWLMNQISCLSCSPMKPRAPARNPPFSSNCTSRFLPQSVSIKEFTLSCHLASNSSGVIFAARRAFSMQNALPPCQISCRAVGTETIFCTYEFVKRSHSRLPVAIYMCMHICVRYWMLSPVPDKVCRARPLG